MSSEKKNDADQKRRSGEQGMCATVIGAGRLRRLQLPANIENYLAGVTSGLPFSTT
jgi:hypothetical protein